VLPLTTPRLQLRALRRADASVLHAWRNDEKVARYQDWPIPYHLVDAERLVADQAGVTGPRAGRVVHLGVEHAGELIGDIAVGLDETGSLAAIGYTLRADHQGKGFGVEAVGALVDALMARGVHRIAATMDPRNTASAMLLERLGFRYEGRARQGVLIRGSWEDGDQYAILARDRAEWLARPTTPPTDVRLVGIAPGGARDLLRLATHHTQRRFVAPMDASFADALVPEVEGRHPVMPWLRVIEADGEPVGFMMVAEPRSADEPPYLWRLLVDRRHQGRGIGARAVGLLIERLRAEGHTRLQTSFVRERGGPEPFYRKLGFVLTGEIEDGEHVAELRLDRPAAAAGAAPSGSGLP
jgi:RimJ/RimL family protein N-acetyltransferase